MTLTKYRRFPKVFCPAFRSIEVKDRKKGYPPACLRFGGFIWQTDSWSQLRRVVVKAAITHTHGGQKPELTTRFLVTNLMAPHYDTAGRKWRAKRLYNFYGRRGEQENRIKEWKLDLESGRTSCHRFEANQFRLLLHTAAMLLVALVQEQLPPASQWKKLQAGTLRCQLLKVAARIIVSCRRIHILLPSSFPHAAVWHHLNHSLAPPTGPPLPIAPV